MCDFVESLTLWSGAAIVTNAGTYERRKGRDEDDDGRFCVGERRLMEAAISGCGDGLNETPQAYCLPEKWVCASVNAEK
jgi:hypothetical protein